MAKQFLNGTDAGALHPQAGCKGVAEVMSAEFVDLGCLDGVLDKGFERPFAGLEAQRDRRSTRCSSRTTCTWDCRACCKLRRCLDRAVGQAATACEAPRLEPAVPSTKVQPNSRSATAIAACWRIASPADA